MSWTSIANAARILAALKAWRWRTSIAMRLMRGAERLAVRIAPWIAQD